MMMETVRVTFAPNKWPQAVEWAENVTAYIKKAGRQLSLLRPRTGDRNAIIWLIQHSSLAEADEAHEKLKGDSEYMKIWREGATADWYIGQRRTYWEVLSE